MVLHFPGGAIGLDPVCQFGRPSLGREDPLEESMATIPAFLPGESHEKRSLVGYSPWCCTELNTTEATSHKIT